MGIFSRRKKRNEDQVRRPAADSSIDIITHGVVLPQFTDPSLSESVKHIPHDHTSSDDNHHSSHDNGFSHHSSSGYDHGSSYGSHDHGSYSHDSGGSSYSSSDSGGSSGGD